MLAELAQQMRNDALEQGIEQGRIKGRKEGISEGMIRDKQIILKKLLSRRFQTRNSLLLQIDHCSDAEKLDNALEEILTAETIEEVLELLK